MRLAYSTVPKTRTESIEYHSFQAVKAMQVSRLLGEPPIQTVLFPDFFELIREIDRWQPTGTYKIYRVAVAPSGVPGRRKRIATYTKYEKSS